MKFHSKPIGEHSEVPTVDNGAWEEIVAHWTQRENATQQQDTQKNACYVLAVSDTRDPQVQNAQLSEITSLVKAQGDCVVGQEIYYLAKKHPQTLLGKGTAQDIAARAHERGANMLVLDAELSPSQMRNLEDMTGIAICDREGIILNVFLRHAKTRSAKIQIEIAQLEYLRPRIRGIGMDMDQQAGGISGSRGAGETASELLARKLDSRLAELKKAQQRIERVGEKHRQQRNSSKRITLLGYTNAGKTSLMNALVGEQLSSRNMPFETLDTTSRALSRHGGDVIISDTVGFIRRLPKSLLPSFESTLAEICDASLLVIVVDLSDYEWQQHLQITNEMLDKLNAREIPRFYVFNKIDRVQQAPCLQMLNAITDQHKCTALSSKDSVAVSALKEELLQTVRSEEQTCEICVPYTKSDVLSFIYGKTRVVSSEATAEHMHFCIQAPAHIIAKIKQELRK